MVPHIVNWTSDEKVVVFKSLENFFFKFGRERERTTECRREGENGLLVLVKKESGFVWANAVELSYFTKDKNGTIMNYLNI